MSETKYNADPSPREAIQSCEQGQPPAQGRVGRLLYAASYYVSYSVTLPTLLVAKVVPQNSVVWQGLHGGACDGACAGERFQAQAVLAAKTARDKVGEAYALAATRIAQRVESIQDTIAERRYRRRIATT